FQNIAIELVPDFSLYDFDLFFHGVSYLLKKHIPLTKPFLAKFIRKFLKQEQVNKFSVMGFSMGGKFVLSLLEAFPEQVNRAFLIAPDGIHTHFWYNIATYPGWLQGIFKRTVVKPKFFFGLLNKLQRYRLVDNSLVRFAEFQMSSTAKRLRVYKSWIGFRELSFDIRKIVNLLNRQQIHVTVFLGEYDQIISRKRVEVFVNALDSAHLVLLKTGHTHLLHDVATYIRRNGHILQKA
ncbi:MAG: alpha/beta hydrolase, partial [Hymenobacteraceae bacterium]|nr:alpha/beta hydrolase [Hymenobacteraceae bacterium]MDX5396843.1 alpha/beta hydrolase [Hymenobacteraceae bacterium]MDX5512914.1 alpha/beta hydrolase [Hymenobacteraceae bacterium]